MQRISIDDLTEEDFSNCRINLRKFMHETGKQMDYESFVNIEINQYNLGNPTVIKPKFISISKPIQQPDVFEEVKEPVKLTKTTALESNIGKRIYLESTTDGFFALTLVATSEEADPDNHKVSVYSDLGQLVKNAQQDDVLEYKDSLIEVIRIRTY